MQSPYRSIGTIDKPFEFKQNDFIMKTRPFLIVTFISGGIQVLFVILSALITYLVMPNLLNQFENFNNLPTPNFGLFTGFTVFGGCIFLLGLVLHFISGGGYAYLHAREEPVTPEAGALGGAASAGLAKVIAGLVGAFLNIIFFSVFLQRIGFPMDTIPQGERGIFFNVSMLSTTFGGIIGTCISGTIAAALGAIGGAIAGAFIKSDY